MGTILTGSFQLPSLDHRSSWGIFSGELRIGYACLLDLTREGEVERPKGLALWGENGG